MMILTLELIQAQNNQVGSEHNLDDKTMTSSLMHTI